MEQLIDFDGLFEEKLAQYMQLNKGKYTASQWEARIPKLYRKFGDTFIPKAKNTPRGYFAAMGNAELAALLVRYVAEKVSVPDFLLRELEGRDCQSELVPLLRADAPGQLVSLLIGLLGSDERAIAGYFDILKGVADDALAEQIAECLKENADAAKTGAVALCRIGIRRELMLEILSCIKEQDDEVFEILLRDFRESGEECAAARRLANYGDARAIPAILEVLDRDDTDFLTFQELRCAVETLGGVYEKERDFSADPAYLELSEKSD